MLFTRRKENTYTVSNLFYNKLIFILLSRPIPKLDGSKDSSESFMNMVEGMYENGDDDTKRAIAKAWVQSREKANAFAAKQNDRTNSAILETPDFTLYPPSRNSS
jgi:hypothetical protein